MAFWTLGLAAVAALIIFGITWWILPNAAEVAKLRGERDELASSIEH